MVFSPTPATACASAIIACVNCLNGTPQNSGPTILNYSTTGQTSPYQFVKVAIDMYDAISPCRATSKLKSLLAVSTDNERDILRPSSSVMSTTKIKQMLSLKILDWKDALRAELVQNIHLLKEKYEFLE